MSYLRYLLLLDIHIFYHFANKRIPHTLIVIKSRDLKQEKKQTNNNKDNQTLTENNQWCRKALINMHTVRFGFLLQDMWGSIATGIYTDTFSFLWMQW
jgi:hypothetical protein